jgi:hypothetical protein
MGLLLAEGKPLKHLKEKPQHKTPYHDLSFCEEEPRSRRYGRNAAFRLLVQPHDEAYYYYYYFRGNSAPTK